MDARSMVQPVPRLSPGGTKMSALEAGVYAEKYCSVCKPYQLEPNAGVVTCLSLHCEALVIQNRPTPFLDLDLHPLLDTLAAYPQALASMRLLDLTGAQLGTSGATMVAHILGLPECRVEKLIFAWQHPGREGIAVLIQAAKACKSLTVLSLRGCHLGDDGGASFVALLEEGRELHGLLELDLQNNYMSKNVCENLERLSRKEEVHVHLLRNHNLDDILAPSAKCLMLVLGSLAIIGICIGQDYLWELALFLFLGWSITVIILHLRQRESLGERGDILLQLGGILCNTVVPLLAGYRHCCGAPSSVTWHRGGDDDSSDGGAAAVPAPPPPLLPQQSRRRNMVPLACKGACSDPACKVPSALHLKRFPTSGVKAPASGRMPLRIDLRSLFQGNAGGPPPPPIKPRTVA